MTSGTMRLFVAASIPHDQLEWLAARTAPLRVRWPDARWAPIENQHVTVKFLGWVAPAALDDVVTVCRAVARGVEPASLALTSLGAFPNARRARVLWVGLDDPDGALSRLAQGLDEGFEPLGIAAEKRSFSPHLTVARFKAPQPLKPLPDLGAPPQPFELAGFSLWRSHLSPKGARYEVIQRFPLEPVTR